MYIKQSNKSEWQVTVHFFFKEKNNSKLFKRIKLSVESQKGVIAVQRCSIENQKGAIAVQSLWRYRPPGSQQNIFDMQ